MRDKYVKDNNFLKIQKKNRDLIVWKEIINHRKYIGANLKWCIGDGRKVCFGQIIGFIWCLLFLSWTRIIYITLVWMPKCMIL